ncbi:MAG: hypothetical protein E7055_19030 [Lentisphaerae bacterium]|nr:hypothetical protein [Lentisphaerota bacterium]
MNFDYKPIPEDAFREPDHPESEQSALGAFRQWEEEYFRRQIRDESKVPPVTLPPIPDTLAEWEAQKPEILVTAKKWLYGVMPPPPDQIEIKLLAERKDALGGTAVRREYRIYCIMNNGRKFDFDMMLYVPVDAKTPPPVFVIENFYGNQASTPDPDVRPTRAFSQVPGYGRAINATLVGQLRNYRTDRLNYMECIRRGYAIATACYGEIFPDNGDGARKSLFTLFYDDLRPDYEISVAELQEGRHREYAAYSGWAWGYSRMADALEKIPLVDSSKMACVGQSRLGATSMWAGINDPRFKLVCVNNSGQGGAPLLRRKFGGRISILSIGRCSFWATDRVIRFADREEDLPFDSHQLLGLIAPRALYVTSSSKDLNADPYGTFLATAHASKVWNLYGQKGLETMEMPPVDTPVGNRVRYHVKTGTHSITPYDWEQYYNFADELFGATGADTSRLQKDAELL